MLHLRGPHTSAVGLFSQIFPGALIAYDLPQRFLHALGDLSSKRSSLDTLYLLQSPSSVPTHMRWCC